MQADGAWRWSWRKLRSYGFPRLRKAYRRVLHELYADRDFDPPAKAGLRSLAESDRGFHHPLSMDG